LVFIFIGKPLVVALKLMKYKSQFVKEIGIRKQLDSGGVKSSNSNAVDNAFVIPILSSHIPRNNKDSLDDNQDLFELLNYGYCDRREPNHTPFNNVVSDDSTITSTEAVHPSLSNTNNSRNNAHNSQSNYNSNNSYNYSHHRRSSSIGRGVSISVRKHSEVAIPVRSMENKQNQMNVRNTAKYNAEKLFCIIMPLASTNLLAAMKQERFMTKNIKEIKSLYLQVLRSVEFIHSKGLVHGINHN